MNFHNTVLCDEAVAALNIKPNGIYVDGTFGRGGHSKLILSALGQSGRLLAVDKDKTAIDYGKKLFNNQQITLIHSDFAELPNIMNSNNLMGKIDGILLDLGMSSPQLDDPKRGFSFHHNGPLDMRMDPTSGISTKEWLRNADEKEIADVLWRYGQERKSRQIANIIVKTRAIKPLENTDDLVACITKVLGKTSKKHPATRTFQAIRIFINQELQALEKLLNNTRSLLKIGGRLVVISFHSLEDRLVKNLLRPKIVHIPTEIPIILDAVKPIFKEVIKKIKPSALEISKNRRSRSAIMRVGERVL